MAFLEDLVADSEVVTAIPRTRGASLTTWAPLVDDEAAAGAMDIVLVLILVLQIKNAIGHFLEFFRWRVDFDWLTIENCMEN